MSSDGLFAAALSSALCVVISVEGGRRDGSSSQWNGCAHPFSNIRHFHQCYKMSPTCCYQNSDYGNSQHQLIIFFRFLCNRITIPMPMSQSLPTMRKEMYKYSLPGRSAIIFPYFYLLLHHNLFTMAFFTRHLQCKEPNFLLFPQRVCH